MALHRLLSSFRIVWFIFLSLTELFYQTQPRVVRGKWIVWAFTEYYRSSQIHIHGKLCIIQVKCIYKFSSEQLLIKYIKTYNKPLTPKLQPRIFQLQKNVNYHETGRVYFPLINRESLTKRIIKLFSHRRIHVPPPYARRCKNWTRPLFLSSISFSFSRMPSILQFLLALSSPFAHTHVYLYTCFSHPRSISFIPLTTAFSSRPPPQTYTISLLSSPFYNRAFRVGSPFHSHPQRTRV